MDSGQTDSGQTDSGYTDSGLADSDQTDSGYTDSGSKDAAQGNAAYRNAAKRIGIFHRPDGGGLHNQEVDWLVVFLKSTRIMISIVIHLHHLL